LSANLEDKMASSKDYLDFILEQISEPEELPAPKRKKG